MMEQILRYTGSFLIMVIIVECIIYYGSLRFIAYLSRKDNDDTTNGGN